MPFTLNLLWLPLIMVVQFLFTLGIIFISGAINVYVRDLEYIINFIIQLCFYATPILYDIGMFAAAPKWIYTLLRYNPMAVIIGSYRDIFYWGNMPQLKSLLAVLGGSILLCIIGHAIFKKLAKGFAEEV